MCHAARCAVLEEAPTSGHSSATPITARLTRSCPYSGVMPLHPQSGFHLIFQDPARAGIGLPCWGALLAAGSPSTCLVQPLTGRKSTCFPMRWSPVGANRMLGERITTRLYTRESRRLPRLHSSHRMGGKEERPDISEPHVAPWTQRSPSKSRK